MLFLINCNKIGCHKSTGTSCNVQRAPLHPEKSLLQKMTQQGFPKTEKQLHEVVECSARWLNSQDFLMWMSIKQLRTGGNRGFKKIYYSKEQPLAR